MKRASLALAFNSEALEVVNAILSQMVTYLICDLRKEFFKRVQARFR